MNVRNSGTPQKSATITHKATIAHTPEIPNFHTRTSPTFPAPRAPAYTAIGAVASRRLLSALERAVTPAGGSLGPNSGAPPMNVVVLVPR